MFIYCPIWYILIKPNPITNKEYKDILDVE